MAGQIQCESDRHQLSTHHNPWLKNLQRARYLEEADDWQATCHAAATQHAPSCKRSWRHSGTLAGAAAGTVAVTNESHSTTWEAHLSRPGEASVQHEGSVASDFGHVSRPGCKRLLLPPPIHSPHRRPHRGQRQIGALPSNLHRLSPLKNENCRPI